MSPKVVLGRGSGFFWAFFFFFFFALLFFSLQTQKFLFALPLGQVRPLQKDSRSINQSLNRACMSN